MSDLDYDPYRLQRAAELRESKLARAKAKLRKAAGKGPSRRKAQREPVTSIAKVESDRSRKNSRVKGSRGELDVAKLFSQWCGELVKRTPGSGGWGGSQEFGTTADLICTNKAFPFHVECKHREGWVLDDLVTGTRAEDSRSVVRWWDQCWASCPKTTSRGGWLVLHKEPLLVFRRNRQPWLVMCREVSEHRPELCPPAIFKLANCEADEDNVVVMLLEEFLTLTPVPKGLRNHAR